MRNTPKTGKTYSRAEAEEILSTCHELRKDIDRLMIKAMRALRPRLELVKGVNSLRES